MNTAKERHEEMLQKKIVNNLLNPEERKNLWKELTLIGNIRNLQKNQQEYNSKCKEIKDGKETLVDKDVSRTKSYIPADLSHNQMALNITTHILKIYNKLNRVIQYNQGLNFIALKIVLVIEDEAESFYVFRYFIESVLPLNQYQNDIEVMLHNKGCSTAVEIFWEHLIDFQPGVVKKCEQIDFDFRNLFIHKWFLTLFTDSFDFKVVLRFWDMILVRKQISVFLIAQAIVGLLQELINYSQSEQQAHNLIKEYNKMFFTEQNVNRVFDLAFSGRFKSFEKNQNKYLRQKDNLTEDKNDEYFLVFRNKKFNENEPIFVHNQINKEGKISNNKFSSTVQRKSYYDDYQCIGNKIHSIQSLSTLSHHQLNQFKSE